jgi:hypothetical protein
MGVRRFVLFFSAVIALALSPAGVASAAPPTDSTNFADDPFLLESDYFWTANTAGYDTFNGEPGTVSNPNPADPSSDCSTTGMQATSWWQIHGTGRDTLITTASTSTNYDTVLAVYEEGAGNVPGDYVTCVDDTSSSNRAAVVLSPSEPGTDYWIQVGGFNGATGTLRIGASSDAPGNDDRAAAQPLAVGPQTFWENFGATPVDVDDNCLGTSEQKTVWFQYTSPERGNVTVDVTGGFNLLIGVYRGSEATALNCGHNIGTTTARAESGDQDAGTYFLEVGALDDHDDYFAGDFDADEAVFGVEVRFTPDPDDDDDGVADGSDRCPQAKGTGLVRDCPDPDSDSFADGIDDRCPGLGGRDANRYQGCPDNDGDGVPEGPGGRDGCGGVNPSAVGRRDRNGDGCPDTLLLHKLVKLSRSVVFANGGIRLLSFAVTGVPRGARVVVVCKLPSGRRCGGVTVRRASARAQAARNIRPRNLQGKVLPFGTKITARTTARYATGSFIRFTAARNSKGFTEKTFCTNRGSKKLRRRGCR